ncbi:hypothetical protein BJ322DRAFT_1107208 [Thelephora terrestris]|uniref:Uncharacterized protein n=1 Tax=Thelephora terrestris TaxID=56493 RepID=A0A9P6HHF3_9AGAM|nr:hypothetical protein BJ322DRAFT_1107208 [Thelephora terrestris]
MFSRAIISSLLLTAFVNGLAIRRDDGYYSSSSTPPALSLPTVTPEPILLPVPSVSLSLPPLDLNPTSTPVPSLSSSSLSPSIPVVTTTVYVYPSQCTPTPTVGPSDVPNHGPSTQPTPITLPQASPLNLHPVRRGYTDSVAIEGQAESPGTLNLGNLGIALDLSGVVQQAHSS